MSATFDIENVKMAAGINLTSINVDMPPNGATDYLVIGVSFIRPAGYGGGSATLTPPTGWTGAGVTASSGVLYFTHAGNHSTPATISFSVTVTASVCCFKMSGQASSSPFSGASTGTSGGFSHTMNAITTAPFPGAVFIGFITAADTGRSFSSNNQPIAEMQGFSIPVPPIISGGPPALSVGYMVADTAGSTGSLNWSSYATFAGGPEATTSQIAGFWIAPLQAPSPPVVLTPETNDQATIESTVLITWNPSTDPNVDTEDIEYKIEVTENGGLTWDVVLALTGPGDLSYNWDTTGMSAGNTQLRVTGYNGTDFGEAGYSGIFQLFDDVVPGPPTGLQPTGIISKDAARDFTWIPNNPDADTQSAYKLDYSSNPDMSSPTSTGKVTSTSPLKNFAANTGILSSVGVKYWRVATYGAVDDTQGAWSQIATVDVRTPPNPPDILSPTNAVPPVTARPTVTITAGSHDRLRHRWVKSGIELANIIVQTSGVTFQAPFDLRNLEVWDLYVSIFKDGLESAEDHEQFTVTYTGPAEPTITATPLPDSAGIQLAVGNSDTPAYTRILRHEGDPDTAIFISPRLPRNATFLDRQVKSGIEYTYIARSYTVAGGFTDSDPGDSATLELDRLHIATVDKTSTSSNAALTASVLIEGRIIKEYVKSHKSVKHYGRTKNLTYVGQSQYLKLTYNCVIVRAEVSTAAEDLKRILASDVTKCIRDSAGNRIFGQYLELPFIDEVGTVRFQLVAIEGDHQEAIR